MNDEAWTRISGGTLEWCFEEAPDRAKQARQQVSRRLTRPLQWEHKLKESWSFRFQLLVSAKGTSASSALRSLGMRPRFSGNESKAIPCVGGRTCAMIVKAMHEKWTRAVRCGLWRVN